MGNPRKEPFTSIPEQVLNEKWYNDENRYHPPEFTDKSVREFPKKLKLQLGKDIDSKAVRWNGKEFTMKEWQDQIQLWQQTYPNVKNPEGGNRHETVRYRGSQTTSPKIIKECWDKCTRVQYSTSTFSGTAIRNFLEKFRVGLSVSVFVFFQLQSYEYVH